MQSISKDSLLASLPDPWSEDVLPAIRDAVLAADRSIVVVDDDPTGTQTVYDVPVLTEWTRAAIEREFISQTPLFYVQTNSRSCLPERAQEIAREVGQSLLEASKSTGRQFSVISRSDSTLRGHYPAEVDTLADTLGMQHAIRIIAPFFEEGGRLTIEDIHWVEEDEMLIPAAETPFAQDASFGYASSNLCEWVEEKTAGKVPAGEVATITVDRIRTLGPKGVKEQLLALPPGSVCVLNAALMGDLEVAALGCIEAERVGASLLYRTGASFVRAYAGLEKRPLLKKAELNLPETGGGLIIVGSHVPMSTRQLEHMIAHTNVLAFELDAAKLLDPGSREGTITWTAELVKTALMDGQDVVLSTSRHLIRGDSRSESLRIAGVVSSGIVAVVSHLEVRPRYIVAKGGITSSDVATQGLGVQRATVLGQIIPGVPVNILGEESRFPGLVYIVFPGNVGRADSVTNVVHRLSLPGYDH